MSKRGHVPLRRCIGCRKRKKKEDMIRLVKGSDGKLSIDETKERNGRGYYLCPDRACLKLAQKKIGGQSPQDRWIMEIAPSKAVSEDERFTIEEERE